MFSNKFRKGAGRAAVALATTALLATGVAPAHAADATPLYMSFEAGDTLGVAAAGQAFEGAAAEIADSAHLTGKALKFTKSGQAWGGVNAILSPAASAKLAGETLHTITFDYWSNDSGPSPVMVALETSVPSWQGGPKTAKALQAQPGLNQLSFDMSTGNNWNAATEWATLVIFPNFGADDTGYTGAAAAPVSGQVYEIDNISVNGGTIANVVRAPRVATSTLLTFEESDTLGGLAAGNADANKPQGGFEGLSTSIADAPAGGNGGKALKMVKEQGAQTYAGVNLVKFAADTRVTDATNKVITMNYYSAKANSTVRLEVRPYPAALGLDVTATKIGWQTLTFDFTNVAGWTGTEEFVGLTLFPDFNVAGGNTTYYVDAVAFNGATTPALPTVVVAVKPAVRVAATVAGTAKVGKTLTAGKGTWTGTATIAYTYKWYRCTVVAKTAGTAAPASSAKCSAISGGTKSTYKAASADVGKYLRVLVTAKNSAGSTLSLSKSTTVKVAK